MANDASRVPDERTVHTDPEAVRRARAARGLTQSALARMLPGLSAGLVGICERREKARPVQISNLARIAGALGVPLVQLVRRDERWRFEPAPAERSGVQVDLVEVDRKDPDPANPSVHISKLPITSHLLVGREVELERLTAAWLGDSVNVVQVTAAGGVGKTALVNGWLASLRRGGWPDARRVWAWSFYAQGTTHGAGTSDEFFAEAFRWFGVELNTFLTPWGKGHALADLFRRESSILVLDGVETLQNPSDRFGPSADSRIRDGALESLLQSLGCDFEAGLCVTTSRIRIANLAFDAAEGRVENVDLDRLDAAAGADLLHALGVIGDREEIECCANEFGGHCLALHLLGSLLVDAHHGQVDRRREVELLAPGLELASHAERVMAAYEEWFRSTPELAALYLLSLFDRQTDPVALGALRSALDARPPESPAPLPPMFACWRSGPSWRSSVTRLRRLGLVSTPGRVEGGLLDMHPLLREYFGRKFLLEHPELWRRCHAELFEHMCFVAPARVERAADIYPLYQAIAHGVRAGLHNTAFEDVYMPRLQRGKEHKPRELGALDLDLAAVSLFFDDLQQPLSSLPADRQLYVLHQRGFCLRALCRLEEAVGFLSRAALAAADAGHHAEASVYSATVSSACLSLARLRDALEWADTSLLRADLAGDPRERVKAHVGLSNLHLRLGDADRAEVHLEAAGRLRKETRGSVPLLHSASAYGVCDHLIGRGEFSRVEGLIADWRGFHTGTTRGSTFVDLLELKLLLRKGASAASDSDMRGVFARAVADTKLRGRYDQLPHIHLECAGMWFERGRLVDAAADVKQALFFATRDPGGAMLLHVADGELLSAGIEGAGGHSAAAERHRLTAAEIMDASGYRRG